MIPVTIDRAIKEAERKIAEAKTPDDFIDLMITRQSLLGPNNVGSFYVTFSALDPQRQRITRKLVETWVNYFKVRGIETKEIEGGLALTVDLKKCFLTYKQALALANH